MPPKSKKKLSLKLPAVDDILSIINNNKLTYVDSLKEFVELYSSPFAPKDISYSHKLMAMKRAVDILKSFGAEVEECFGEYEPEDKKCPYESVPIILATLKWAPEKPTVLVYCQMDGTGQTPNFSSSAKYVRGRGAIDAASFLIWIDMVLAHKEMNLPVPYNIKFCLDFSSRSDVTQLIDVLHSKINFLENVKFCFTCCSHGIARKIPDIIYGVRGVNDFYLKIRKESNHELYNGKENGGELLEMMQMLNTIVDSDGDCLIKKLNKNVSDVTDEERIWFSSIDFNPERLNRYFSVRDSLNTEKELHLEKLWQCPAIRIKGIETSSKNQDVIGEFIVHTVPKQTPKFVRAIVLDYLSKKWKEIDSTNNLELGMPFWSWPWRADQSDKKYNALINAVTNVYGERPQAILSGSYMSFPAILRKMAKKNVLIYSLGSFYDFQLTQDERLSIEDFINAIKVITRMLHFVDNDEEPAPTKGKGKKK